MVGTAARSRGRAFPRERRCKPMGLTNVPAETPSARSRPKAQRRAAGRRTYRGGMAAGGHGAGRRWTIVLVLVAGLLALPSLLGALPASDSGRSAADLRRAVLASGGVGFSGYAESA